MTILFLGYWGVNDPLTVATIFPHLEILASFHSINKIVFTTIEREGQIPNRPTFLFKGHDKIHFEPLISRRLNINILEKINDFIVFPNQIKRIINAFKVDSVISRGAPAGALAYLVWKVTKVPFFVESFEPHADYMLESGVWRRFDPRYIFQRAWEEKQKKYASGLMPVADNYKRKLIQEGIPEARIYTVPVAVHAESFQFDKVVREQSRKRLGFSSLHLVGVYVGKFGDIYYDEEAFQIFKTSFDYFGDSFRLIILSPNPKEKLLEKLIDADIDVNKVFITKSAHSDVPAFLSASDFAFSTIKPAASRIYCSPTKNGEYWASGLPILITNGVGDDSDIIEREGGGAVFDLSVKGSLANALLKMRELLKNPDYRSKVRELAIRHRNLSTTKKAYLYFLGCY
ncbi:hypothetical protein [Rufibacter psychrotolerans]|uniref:hypothetical protein n=1 Tax=Rufibacter psychrotolerans TaxID=2812556 RepID=UPI001967F3FF|nr:hypothetical protein [Rufibacter sp. SYSU D00308]